MADQTSRLTRKYPGPIMPDAPVAPNRPLSLTAARP